VTRQNSTGSHARKRQRVLGSMALVMFVSALLRLSEQAGAAAAQTVAGDAEVSPVERADAILGMPLDDQTLPQLLELFKSREAALVQAEQEAAKREAALAAATDSVREQLDELEAAEEKLASTLATVDVAAADDLARLATVYENMKPRDTAALFAEMAPGFAAGFLGLMRPESAAAIMTELEPNQAHLISVMLAGRNASAPTRE